MRKIEHNMNTHHINLKSVMKNNIQECRFIENGQICKTVCNNVWEMSLHMLNHRELNS